MDADSQNTILALVMVIVALLAFQTIALVALVLALRKLSVRVASLMAIAEETARNAGPVLRTARDMLTESKEKIGLVPISSRISCRVG